MKDFFNLSLTIHPYKPLRLVSPLDGIQCLHIYEYNFSDQPTLICRCVGVSPAVLSKLWSSDLDDLWDGRQVTIQLLF